MDKHEYQKGYCAGSRRRWPEHRPPSPPHPVFKHIVDAAQSLRDETDAIIAGFGEDDEVTQRLGPKIDEFDAAMIVFTNWIKTYE